MKHAIAHQSQWDQAHADRRGTGVPEDFTVKSRDNEDSSLLVISKLAWDTVMLSYPEQSDIIMTNLLFQFGLTRNGEESAIAGRSNPQGDDEGFQQMRQSIKRELRRSQAVAMADLTYAAAMGELQTVKLLLARGLPINQGNYDGRTTLHLAVVRGQSAVAKLLLDKGAHVDVVDRRGSSPLLDAVRHNNLGIADMLISHGAQLPKNCFAEVKEAAETDDAKLSLLCTRAGADVNSSDYDLRSVLHTCCAGGDLKAVESLLANGADPNIKDRCVQGSVSKHLHVTLLERSSKLS